MEVQQPFPSSRGLRSVAVLTSGAIGSDEVTATQAPSLRLDAIHGDQAKIHEHLDGVVRRTVEETLNALLDAEADRLGGAKRYERNAERRDTRAGHYGRTFHTKAGEVELKIPKLRHLPFETAILES